MSQTHTWRAAIGSFFHPRVISLLFLGFSAGIPILLIFSSLSVWLREAEVSRSTVTFFSWAALGYSFKYLWAPLIDRLPLPWLTAHLGRRRAWLLCSQLAVIAAILFMASNDPQANLLLTAVAAVLLGFSSATQDIVIDAYRIEAADKDLQAMMASSYIAGYRIGMLLAGAGALKLAGWFGGAEGYDYRAWALAYACMAGAMLIGVVTTLIIPEPAPRQADTARAHGTFDYLRFLLLFIICIAVFAAGFVWFGGLLAEAKHSSGHLGAFLLETLRFGLSLALAVAAGWLLTRAGLTPAGMVRTTYVAPLSDFISRYGKAGLLLLLLIGTYRIADIVMGVVANVFYVDLGFSKDQIADIAKTFGLLMTIVGGFLGGLLAVRYGLIRILFLGALLAALTNLLFAGMASWGASVDGLILVIAADNLSAGLASAAFVAYLSSLTSIAFTATQYALFSSLMTLLPKLLAGYSGMLVDSLGYPWFFTGTAILGIPVLLLVVLAARLEQKKSSA